MLASAPAITPIAMASLGSSMTENIDKNAMTAIATATWRTRTCPPNAREPGAAGDQRLTLTQHEPGPRRGQSSW